MRPGANQGTGGWGELRDGRCMWYFPGILEFLSLGSCPLDLIICMSTLVGDFRLFDLYYAELKRYLMDTASIFLGRLEKIYCGIIPSLY